MNVNQWMEENRTATHAKPITCKDGTTLSVQAGRYLYSSPREDKAFPYTAVEIGFPSIKPSEEIMKYCESPEMPTDTVYGYVPVELVDKFVTEHGGFKE